MKIQIKPVSTVSTSGSPHTVIRHCYCFDILYEKTSFGDQLDIDMAGL